ncbi:MAG: Ig-like domain-containing protein, partial [Thalassobaculum sp.]|uniref:beta strand repeat-containing protein n=1 Tax=Thalassobaculum sp. TaxID=2022740 RepID=UPI0032EBC6AB
TTIDVVRSDGTAMAGVSSGFLDAGVIGNTVTYTLTFGSAVNITQFQIGEFANNTGSGNYVFTPNTGTAVVIADDSGSLAGSVATLTPTDWTGVTSFTVSYTGSVSYRIGLDNISFTSAGPATPGTPDLLAASDTGVSSTDNITSNSLPTIAGTADASTSVHILVGGVTVGTTTSDGGGNWTYAFTSTLAAGANSVTAIADNGTTESSASTALSITVDTTAPTTLGTPDLLAASDNGVSSTDNITNATTQQLSGSATTGDIVSILVGGVTVNNVTAAGGSWSYTHTLTAGTYSITSQATDTAGNAGPVSTALSITIDTTAPTTLGTPDLLAASDTGASSTDNITSSTTQQLSGSATTGDIVSILVGGVTVNNVTAAGGSWSYTHTLTAGTYSITTQATDTAGNAGPASTALSLTVDTTAPATAGTPDLLAASDTGVSSTDNITSNNLPTFTGTSEASASVHILLGGTTVGTTTADGGGNWTYTFTTTLAAGANSITSVATDAAGNAGPASTALSVTVGNAPVFSSLNGGATFTQNGTAATIDSDVTVSDTEFAALNGANGNFAGGSLVIVRNGGAVTSDTFAFNASGGVTQNGTNLLSGGNTIASFDTTTAGQLTVTFANNGTIPTTALVNTVLQNITFSNAATAQVGTATLNWTFSDGTLTSTGTNQSTVTIAAAPDNGGGGGGGGGSSGGDSTGTIVVTPTTPTVIATNTSQTITNNGSAAGSAAIVQNTGNNSNLVTATLPASVSITSEGPATAQSGTTASATLVTAIQARGSTGQTGLVNNAGTFLNRLSTTSTLDIRTIVPTQSSGATTSDPIIITGSTGTGQSEAFVIDMRSITGKTLQLDNIEFASIIGNATVSGGSGNNYATGDDASQFISLGVGDDTLFGGEGDDTVASGGGLDELYGEAGNDMVIGGAESDTVYGGADQDVVYGNQAADVVYGNQGVDTLYGGQDNDTLFGGQHQDLLYGNFGDDVLYGNLGGDTMYGGLGNDVLYGGDSEGSHLSTESIDYLFGGQGNDTLYGGKGADLMAGGDGNDVVVIQADGGADTVSDFAGASGDRIHITANVNGTSIDTFAELQAAAANNTDGNAVITLGTGNTLTLTGVNTSQLQSDWFLFI